MEGWENFFLGQVGASAALGGLLFVAVSLNLARILALPRLADRALLALSLILAILIISSAMLIPDQSASILGVEVLLVGVLVTGLGIKGALAPFDQSRGGNRTKGLINVVLFGFAVLPYVIGGLVLLGGGLRAGLYWVAVSIVFSFIKAVLEAWVLLIEINR
jgi:modulator of FtsH protease